MNTYSLIVLVIRCTLGFYDANLYYHNVGTVLFNSSDVYRSTWNKNQIGLLRARRYFQTTIPHAKMISLNEDFAENVLLYFKNTFHVIKREVPDPIDYTILSVALSDVIGGYLKAWALPVARYSFYGGTISSDKALKLHDYYSEVKNYLGTDGSGWRGPDTNLLRSIEINVPPRRLANSRHILDACENLAFFENTPNGLAVPIPRVNWDSRSYTMFIPLKNESLISLTSPETTDALFRYYDTAKNCMENSSSTKNQIQFDENFQNWLAVDVMPHLHDENLYLAFGNILTLVNKTKILCDTVIDLCAKNNHTKTKFMFSGFPINLASKKLMIISVIIFLEIIWCVPALIYLVCVKKNKKKAFHSNTYFFEDARNYKQRKPNNRLETRMEVDAGTDPNQFTNAGLKFSQNPKRKYHKGSLQKTVATECSSTFVSKSCFVDANIVNYASRSVQLKSSLRKIAKSSNNPISVSSHEVSVYSPDNVSIGHSETFSAIQKLEATKTVTLIKETEKDTKKKTCNERVASKHETKEKKSKKQQMKIEASKSVLTLNAVKSDEKKECPCTCCLNEDKNFAQDSNIITIEEELCPRTESCTKCCSKCSIKKCDTINILPQFEVHDEIKANKNRPLTVCCNRNPYVEITIDRPQRNVCLEITGTTKKGTSNLSEIKTSKIPTRALKSREHAYMLTSKKTQNPYSSLKKKSLIPQLKRPVDDTVIKNTKVAGKKSKLNVTL